MASPNTMAKLQELAKLRQQEIDKQSKAFGTLFGHGKRCSNNNPGVEVFICVRSKFSDQWSVGGFGPTAGRKPVRKAAKAACRVVVARHEGAIVEVNEEQRAPGVQFLEMGVQKGIISPKQVDLMLGVLEEQDAEKAAKQAKAKKLTEKLRRKGGPDLVLGGAGSQERNGGAGGSAEEGGVSGSGGKGEGPSGSGEGSGGSTARVPAELPVGGVLSGGVDAGSSGDCAWDSAGPEPAVPDTTHKPVQGRAAAEAAQLLSELEPVWQRVKKVVQSDTEEESEGASLGEGLQLSDSEEEEFISPRSTAADSSDSEDEVLISRAKRQQAAPSRSRRVVVLTDRAREAGLHLGGSRATSQPLAAADDGEPSGSGAGASGTGGGSGAGVSGTGSGSSDVSGGGGEAGPGGSLGQEVFKLKPDHETLKLGEWALDQPNPLQYYNGANETGFEPLLAEELANAAGVDFQVVRLATLPERFSALTDGRADLVIGGISVTPERQQIVDFVKPYYYTSRAGLYAPGGQIQGVSNWTDLKGKAITSFDGYYANNEVAANGAQLVLVNDPQAAADKIKSGEAQAFLDDTGYDYSSLGLAPVSTPAPILPLPYGIAVAKGNSALATRLGNAMLKLVQGGQNAPILAIEKETFGADGFPPNKDLADLVANPTGTTLLNPGS